MDNNIALITALFNEKGANFYKDIYFPIIRYALVGLFNEHDGNESYFTVGDLQEYIRNKFFIEIPVVVLRNSVVALRGRTQADIVIEETLGKHDDGIYIKRIIDDQWSESIEREAEIVEDKFNLLENLFQQYIAAEHLESSTNLYDFISECEDECYDMVAGADNLLTKGINEEYSNTARFINWLKSNRIELYQYFVDIVWASVVSAFLRRNKHEAGIKPSEKVTYYLDSALVLALFNLDTGFNVSYAKDVLHNVHASGGSVVIHSMTYREVDRILNNVIFDQGPRFGSAIAYGFEENNLSLSDIVSLRNNLGKRLKEEFGIVVEPYNQQLLEEAEKKLENNANVLFLKEKWGSYSSDTFREKHDVFMCETVSKKNNNVANLEKMSAFFVTLNRDLIELYHKSDGLSSVITPSSVVLRLWIHGAQIQNIKEAVLTELISRCLAMSQTDARRKIKLFVKYRKSCDVSTQDVKDMYSSLIHRSNNVILKFNEIEKIDRTDSDDKEASVALLMDGLMEAIHEESDLRHKLYEDSIAKQKMEEDMSKMESGLKAIAESKIEADKIICELQKEKEGNQLLIRQLQDKIERNGAEKLLVNSLSELQTRKFQLDVERNKSGENVYSFWVILVIDILLFIVFALLLIIVICKLLKNVTITWEAASLFAVLSIIILTRDYWLSGKIKKAKCRKEKIEFWEECHPEYSEIKKEISEIERDIKFLRIGKTTN